MVLILLVLLVDIKTTVFWKAMPFILIDANKYFGESYCLHLQEKVLLPLKRRRYFKGIHILP